jgi:hypothetical protein
MVFEKPHLRTASRLSPSFLPTASFFISADVGMSGLVVVVVIVVAATVDISGLVFIRRVIRLP